MTTTGRHWHNFFLLISLMGSPSVLAADTPVAGEDSSIQVGAVPKASSEDSIIPNFHSLGEIANSANIYRCANPVGNIADRLNDAEPSDSDRRQAEKQMQHLYDLGVRTVVSLQRQEAPTATEKNPEYNAVLLEKAAAQAVGMNYIAYSMSNKGKNSLQYMSDDAVFELVETIGNDIVKRSETGGVAFHCKSGKDRTGLVAAYLRLKYQQWSADQAISEMREKGHVWKKFLKPGNLYSWHEEHVREIAKMLTGKISSAATNLKSAQQ